MSRHTHTQRSPHRRLSARRTHHRHSEAGVVLITALLAVMLVTGLMAGMFAALAADERSHAIDRDQSQAYAAAHAGLEKLTSGLATLFTTDFSPSAAQIAVIDSTPPAIDGFEFVAPGGGAGSGYDITFNPVPVGQPGAGSPMATPNAVVTTGPFAGLNGLITPYTLTVTARTDGAEVRLRRELQTVAVPVFQFGIFGEKSLSFFAGANFDFGGRVHTNEHLFLASGATLWFRDRATAVGEVVRAELENGTSITDSGHTGTVKIPKVIGSTYRNLLSTEGSVEAGPGSAPYSGWKTLSESTYQANIRTTLTGAKRLDLPLVSQGAVPVDLIRRPNLLSNEHTANPAVFGQRFYGQASLRILLSDRVADLTGLPSVTATAPVQLDTNWNTTPPGGYTVGVQRPPTARSPGPITMTTPAAGGTGSIAGGITQIKVQAIPNEFKMPANITVDTVPAQVITCTGRVAAQFTGCTGVTAAIPIDTSITATLPSGAAAAASTSSAVAAPATAATPVDIPVKTSAGFFGTAQFSPSLLWAPAGGVVTCNGYADVAAPNKELKDCRGLTAVPANNAVFRSHALAQADAGLINGYLKIEKQDATGVWTDVTMELLNLGFAGPNLDGFICSDPTPNAVIRIQRLRDNAGGDCNGYVVTNPYDYWSNALYDAREGNYRDVATNAAMTMGGLMHYIAIDVANLKRWFAGDIGATGGQAWNNNGYIVYFSDRRGDHNEGLMGDPETGEYGFEDAINPAADAWATNGVLDNGEDFNENGVFDNWGATPWVTGLPPAAAAPYDATGRPWSTIGAANQGQARVNRPVLFRRALKLINGGINGGVNNLPESGLTIATENPVYVQGNYNAIATSVVEEPNRPAAIITDAITLLSNAWNDVLSFRFPNQRTNRPGTQTGYRFALIAGKNMAFPHPAWSAVGDFGTDGGVHNFMRMLEHWGGAINYRGSIVSLYTARQHTGIYRFNTNVYSPGTRNFTFDTDFLTPALLPPGTPMFRDINTLKFRQILRPNQ